MQHWVTRSIQLPRPITGVWEIGPIFSCDRWIPDVLCPALPVRKPERQLTPQPPDPNLEFYVDYCVFFGLDPASLPTYSDDFNIVGYMDNIQTQTPYKVDTWTHPGYMTMTLFGAGETAGIANTIFCYPKLNYFKPPWEIEVCFNAVSDDIPWNLHYWFRLLDVHGKWHWWTPGVQNLPAEKRHFFFNNAVPKSVLDMHNPFTKYDMQITPINLEFDPPVPEKILSAKPLYWLFQVIDTSHLRMAFKAKPEDPWYFSKICEVPKGVDELTEFGCIIWNTLTGRHFNIPPGSPMYQQILFDYVHYRYGLSK